MRLHKVIGLLLGLLLLPSIACARIVFINKQGSIGSGTSVSVTVPAGTLTSTSSSQFLMVSEIACAVSSAASTPSVTGGGWTQFGSTTQSGTTGPMSSLWWRLASSEPGSYTFNASNCTTSPTGQILTFEMSTSSPNDVASQANAASGTTSPTVSLTTTVTADLLVIVAEVNAGTPACPSGYTQAVLQSNNISCYATQNVAGATGNVNLTDGSTTPWAVNIGSFKPFSPPVY